MNITIPSLQTPAPVVHVCRKPLAHTLGANAGVGLGIDADPQDSYTSRGWRRGLAPTPPASPCEGRWLRERSVAGIAEGDGNGNDVEEVVGGAREDSTEEKIEGKQEEEQTRLQPPGQTHTPPTLHPQHPSNRQRQQPHHRHHSHDTALPPRSPRRTGHRATGLRPRGMSLAAPRPTAWRSSILLQQPGVYNYSHSPPPPPPPQPALSPHCLSLFITPPHFELPAEPQTRLVRERGVLLPSAAVGSEKRAALPAVLREALMPIGLELELAMEVEVERRVGGAGLEQVSSGWDSDEEEERGGGMWRKVKNGLQVRRGVEGKEGVERGVGAGFLRGRVWRRDAGWLVRRVGEVVLCGSGRG